MKHIVLLALILALVACSKTQAILGGIGAAVVTGVIIAGGDGGSKPTPPAEAITGADLSGMMLGKGGMLLDELHVLHVAHWPDLTGKNVSFRARDGSTATRRVVAIEVISPVEVADLCLLTLDRPLDLTKHTALPIAPARRGMDVTVVRLDRPPLATRLRSVSKTRLTASAAYEPTPEGESMHTGGNELRAGDSGKPWLAEVDGRICLIGLSSRGWHGESPHLYHLIPSTK
ncbi:MAG: hypothetical protein ACQKBY_09775 [Verrucomicrobiales bacterium]